MTRSSPARGTAAAGGTWPAWVSGIVGATLAMAALALVRLPGKGLMPATEQPAMVRARTAMKGMDSGRVALSILRAILQSALPRRAVAAASHPSNARTAQTGCRCIAGSENQSPIFPRCPGAPNDPHRKRDCDALVVNQGGLMAEMRRRGKPHWPGRMPEGPEERGGRARGLHRGSWP